MITNKTFCFILQPQSEPACPPQFVPNVIHLHMFPAFEELELGLVPSAVETIRLLNSGMPHAYIYSHYFEKPVATDAGTDDRSEDAELRKRQAKVMIHQTPQPATSSAKLEQLAPAEQPQSRVRITKPPPGFKSKPEGENFSNYANPVPANTNGYFEKEVRVPFLFHCNFWKMSLLDCCSAKPY